MQWSSASEPAPTHPMLLSFPSRHHSGWNSSRFVCTCLSHPGIAWSCFGIWRKHRESAELIGLALLSKPWGVLSRVVLQTESLQPLGLPTTCLPHQFSGRKRARKGKAWPYPSGLLHPWAVRPFPCFQTCVLLHLFHSISLYLLNLLVWTRRLSWDKFCLSCAPGWGREGEKEESKGRWVCLCLQLVVQTSGLCKPVLSLTSDKDFILWVKWYVNKRETHN